MDVEQPLPRFAVVDIETSGLSLRRHRILQVAVVTVDVTGQTVSGDNVIEFGPGPLARSFFRVSLVSLELSARVSECMPAEPPPDPTAVRRQMHFHEAVYTNRATWVVPCPPGNLRWAAIRASAFTASGAEH